MVYISERSILSLGYGQFGPANAPNPIHVWQGWRYYVCMLPRNEAAQVVSVLFAHSKYP